MPVVLSILSMVAKLFSVYFLFINDMIGLLFHCVEGIAHMFTFEMVSSNLT